MLLLSFYSLTAPEQNWHLIIFATVDTEGGATCGHPCSQSMGPIHEILREAGRKQRQIEGPSTKKGEFNSHTAKGVPTGGHPLFSPWPTAWLSVFNSRVLRMN
jgi:hypothetical protein